MSQRDGLPYRLHEKQRVKTRNSRGDKMRLSRKVWIAAAALALFAGNVPPVKAQINSNTGTVTLNAQLSESLTITVNSGSNVNSTLAGNTPANPGSTTSGITR